jgi:monofunctional biosynthetic peptidoglycan transglycosylase
VDWGSVREVLVTGSDRGASTIAMQAVRNLMLWQGRSYLRKALEVPIALYADIVLGKRRIMEIYLNVAEWGPGVFGIEAAARHHFGVSVSNLTIRQATLLAVTLPNPHNRDPANPTASLSGLAETIGARVADGVDTSCLDL